MKRRALALAALALGAAGAANPLAIEQGRSRPVVLVAPGAADPVAQAFAQALAQPDTQSAFAERQVIVFTVLAGQGARAGKPLPPGETAALLAALGLQADGPATTLLIGKDGGVKLRRASLSVADIAAAIDGMPMRRREKDKGAALDP